jgi:hypothetical protein
MAAISSDEGMTPASLSALAFTIIMKRIGLLLVRRGGSFRLLAKRRSGSTGIDTAMTIFLGAARNPGFLAFCGRKNQPASRSGRISPFRIAASARSRRLLLGC